MSLLQESRHDSLAASDAVPPHHGSTVNAHINVAVKAVAMGLEARQRPYRSNQLSRRPDTQVIRLVDVSPYRPEPKERSTRGHSSRGRICDVNGWVGLEEVEMEGCCMCCAVTTAHRVRSVMTCRRVMKGRRSRCAIRAVFVGGQHGSCGVDNGERRTKASLPKHRERFRTTRKFAASRALVEPQEHCLTTRALSIRESVVEP